MISFALRFERNSKGKTNSRKKVKASQQASKKRVRKIEKKEKQKIYDKDIKINKKWMIYKEKDINNKNKTEQ